MEDFSSFTIEQLNEILKTEEETRQSLIIKRSQLEKEIQDTNRENEREEEGMMNAFSKKIEILKKENSDMLLKIQAEEEYIKNNLQQKLDNVLKEKESLEMILAYQESQVIDRLQQDIDRLTQEATKLETQINNPEQTADIPEETKLLRRSKSMESLQMIAHQTEQTKKEYETELANLRTDIERLITTNQILMQRIASVQMQFIDRHKNSTEGEEFPSFSTTPNSSSENRRFSDITAPPFAQFPNLRFRRQSKPD